jgi:hypothetical protein
MLVMALKLAEKPRACKAVRFSFPFGPIRSASRLREKRKTRYREGAGCAAFA